MYSEEFKRIISSPDNLKQVFRGSSYSAPSFEYWELGRKFIGKAINQSGTILDIGCGNGFLLRCLQEWQSHELIPYGIDTNPNFIEQAKTIVFPDFENNFSVLSSENISQLSELGLPNSYNLIYWNVWDNWDFGTTDRIDNFNEVKSLLSPSGMLILGFYMVNKHNNLSKIEQLRSKGINPGGVLANTQNPEIVCWFDNIK